MAVKLKQLLFLDAAIFYKVFTLWQQYAWSFLCVHDVCLCEQLEISL